MSCTRVRPSVIYVHVPCVHGLSMASHVMQYVMSVHVPCVHGLSCHVVEGTFCICPAQVEHRVLLQWTEGEALIQLWSDGTQRTVSAVKQQEPDHADEGQSDTHHAHEGQAHTEHDAESRRDEGQSDTHHAHEGQAHTEHDAESGRDGSSELGTMPSDSDCGEPPAKRPAAAPSSMASTTLSEAQRTVAAIMATDIALQVTV